MTTTTKFSGRVRKAGGGVVEILVHRDTTEYPSPGEWVYAATRPEATLTDTKTQVASVTANFEVGDVVRLPHWTEDEYSITVEFVGETYLLGTLPNGTEVVHLLHIKGADWVKVEPTPADQYLVFDSEGDVFDDYPSAAGAVEEAKLRNIGKFPHQLYRVARYTFAEWVEA